MIFGAPFLALAPVANRSSVSDVEVSPSIVTALNVSVTSSFSSARNTGAEIAASVKTKASIVAMSGAIMPAPFAKPLIRTLALPSFTAALASFGNVSVVMMAFAASSHACACARFARSSSTPLNFEASSGSPITPVEARKISPVEQPAAFAASFAVNATCAFPVLPVKALALPELTTSARALPPRNFSRHHSTGADGHFERVVTPATVVPGSSSTRRTSVRP